MEQETLEQLFIDQLKDLYDAEKQIVKALPRMAKAASSEELGEALRKHLDETQNQVGRLEEVFKMMGVPAKGKTCKGMKGLLEEGSEAIKEEEDETLSDLAIIAAAQKVEHYEISAYGTAKTIAEKLGREEAVELLQQTEEEESAADATLTEIATSLYEVTEMEEDEDVDQEEEEEAAAPMRASGTSRRTSSSRQPAKKTSRAGR